MFQVIFVGWNSSSTLFKVPWKSIISDFFLYNQKLYISKTSKALPASSTELIPQFCGIAELLLIFNTVNSLGRYQPRSTFTLQSGWVPALARSRAFSRCFTPRRTAWLRESSTGNASHRCKSREKNITWKKENRVIERAFSFSWFLFGSGFFHPLEADLSFCWGRVMFLSLKFLSRRGSNPTPWCEKESRIVSVGNILIIWNYLPGKGWFQRAACIPERKTDKLLCVRCWSIPTQEFIPCANCTLMSALPNLNISQAYI